MHGNSRNVIKAERAADPLVFVAHPDRLVVLGPQVEELRLGVTPGCTGRYLSARSTNG